MPALGRFQTGEDAFRFLESRPEFRRIYVYTRGPRKGQPRPMDMRDVGAAQWKRYANKMYRYIAEGQDVPNLGWLRGHALTEGHKERTGEKPRPGSEYWLPARKWRTGITEHPDSRGQIVATRYGTRGQAAAAQFLAGVDRITGLMQGSYSRAQPGTRLRVRVGGYDMTRLVRVRGQAVGEQIVIHVTGLKQGQFARLFEKGGYKAAFILRNAGYMRTRRGRWVKNPSDPDAGLEHYLLGYINSQIRSQGEPWHDIAFYEIYWFDEPVRETIDPRSRTAS